MNDSNKSHAPDGASGRFSGSHVALIVLAAVVVTVAATLIILKFYIFPSEFKPVQLSAKEERALSEKITRLGEPVPAKKHRESKTGSPKGKASEYDSKGRLIPERYSEAGMKREIEFTERELNALLAKNTDLATRLAIDLSDDLISAKLLIPVSEDFPVMGGQIIRVRAGLELAYKRKAPVVSLKGVSVMGVPLPNAWLGNAKHINLAEEYGGDEGFWRAFGEGVEEIVIEEGRMKIRLRE